MREPSIHITKDNLYDLIDKYNERHDLGIDIDKLVYYLLSKGKSYQIVTRIPLASFKKDVKKVISGTMSKQDETSLMAQTIRLLRFKDNKYKAAPLVKPGNADWTKTKEVAYLANKFCELYELPRDLGYKTYIRIYMLIKTKAFNLSIINARHEFICDTYAAQLRIEDDEHKDDTTLAYEKYQQIIFERTGNRMDYSSNPVKYACFIDAVDVAKELNLTPEDYVQANFDQLAYKSGIPRPEGLATPLARERAITWMSETEHKTADDHSVEDRYRKSLLQARQDDEDSSK